MDTITLAKADYLDILFENRNKQYGSYELRRHYNQRTLRSLGIVFAISATMIFVYGLISNKKTPAERTISIINCPITPVDPTIIHIPPPKIVEPPASKPTIANAIPKIVDDIKVIVPPPTKEEVASNESGLKTIAGDPNSKSNNTIIGGTSTKPVVVPPTSVPITWSEVMPEFIGNINDYLSKELRYPERAKDLNIEGKVTVQFVVNEDGSVSNARILKGIGADCDAEALRVVSNMPKWKPGLQNDKPVKVYYTLPIRFLLQ